MRVVGLLFLLLFLPTVSAEKVHVAVAANFALAMQQITVAFKKETGHSIVSSFGSTGKLYTQIKNGAPFEVLLAADRKTPSRLVKEGAAIANSQFTYAIGKLLLWSNKPNVVSNNGKVFGVPLSQAQFSHLAIANPKSAPYGAAAMEVINKLAKNKKTRESIIKRLVQGENISQAFQFVLTGNAKLGFVAMSQVFSDGDINIGSAWIIPNEMYQPIRQDAVLLKNAKKNIASKALMAFLKSESALAIMQSHGYLVN